MAEMAVGNSRPLYRSSATLSYLHLSFHETFDIIALLQGKKLKFSLQPGVVPPGLLLKTESLPIVNHPLLQPLGIKGLILHPPHTQRRRLLGRGVGNQFARDYRPRTHKFLTVLLLHPGRLNGHGGGRSEEHTSELQSRLHLVCRLLLEK